MTKKKKRLDSDRLPLFELLQEMQEAPPVKSPGSFNVDRRFRELVSLALSRCPRSRWEVAGRMSELTDTDITKTMIDSWTAESKIQNRFPAVFLPAFCEAVGWDEPLKMLGALIGVFVLPGPEALRAEIQRIEEEIAAKQAERRKRQMFLKEMER